MPLLKRLSSFHSIQSPVPEIVLYTFRMGLTPHLIQLRKFLTPISIDCDLESLIVLSQVTLHCVELIARTNHYNAVVSAWEEFLETVSFMLHGSCKPRNVLNCLFSWETSLFLRVSCYELLLFLRAHNTYLGSSIENQYCHMTYASLALEWSKDNLRERG